MKRISKLMVTSLGLLLTQASFAADSGVENNDLIAQRDRRQRPVHQESRDTSKPCYEPGYPNKNNCFSSGYNAPARLNRKYNFFFNGSFIFWKATQEGMDLAISTSANNNTAGTTVLQPDVASRWLVQEFKYKPGFKIGAGVDLPYDGWILSSEYTRYRHTTTVSNPTPFNDGREQAFAKVWETNNHAGFNPFLRAFTRFADTNLFSRWDLHVDYIDSGLSRPFHQGTRLIYTPFAGIRTQWISQTLVFSGEYTTNTQTDLTPVEVKAKSNSWAVGPRLGMAGKRLLLGKFTFEGEVAGSILWTRYNTAQYHASQPETTPPEENLGGKFRDYDVLRVVNEMNLGVGWEGAVDILVSYDLKVLWNQNMMRQLMSLVDTNVSQVQNNLYLHGLTVKGQIDF